MASTYTYPFPKELVKHVTALCGRAGQDWLRALPLMIGELENEWSINVSEPFRAGEFNFVAPAVREDGELTALKISPPYQTLEILGEAAYLRSRDGLGAVKLLAMDASRRAILIEHASPGKNLDATFEDNKPGAIEPAIEVLNAIRQKPPADQTGIIILDDWFDGLRRHVGTQFPSEYATWALRIYENLSGQADRTFYLHGDFHPGNIVTATRTPYLAIDPKGIIGHLGYEIAVFLNNFHWWQEGEPDVRANLDLAVNQFSSAFNIEARELRQWAFAQMVLTAWWNFDEMPDIYDNEVAKADIWDV